MAADGLEPLRRAFSVEDLAPQAAEHGIAQTVVVQTVSSVEETVEMLALADRGGLVGGVVGWVDLTAPDVADALAALRERPGGERLVAIRHQVHDEPDPDWLEREDVRRGLRAVADAGLVYDLLTFALHLPVATRTVDAVADLAFVLDHISKPAIASGELEPWTADLRALAERPNVTCKLSGMVTEADWSSWTVDHLRPYAEVVLDAFGPQRVMFGSDWPVCTLAASYGEVVGAAEQLTAGLGAEERAAVFADTARRTYRLT